MLNLINFHQLSNYMLHYSRQHVTPLTLPPAFSAVSICYSVYADFRISIMGRRMDKSQLSQEVIRLHADMCSALADPSRLLILYALGEKPRTVSELTAYVNIRQPTTSRHLRVLREHGLVRAARQGQNIEYTLCDHRILDALDMLRAVLRDSLAYRANLIPE